MPTEYAAYGSDQWLSEFQIIMLIGFAATIVLLVSINWDWISAGMPLRRRKSAVAAAPAHELCKLHQRTTDLCQDMHDAPAADEALDE